MYLTNQFTLISITKPLHPLIYLGSNGLVEALYRFRWGILFLRFFTVAVNQVAKNSLFMSSAILASFKW